MAYIMGDHYGTYEMCGPKQSQDTMIHVPCSVFEAEAEVDVLKLEKNNFEKLVVFTFIA